MPHVTSIGLDVHARSVAAAAFNPFTGEVVHRDFGTDAGLCILETAATAQSSPSARSSRAMWKPVGPLS